MTDVVLPCLDEAGALPRVLARIPAGWRAIVVDNGSTDGSGDLARALGATVVHEPRRGFGAACAAGLAAATAELVCFCDCDGSLDPGLLPLLTDRITAGTADLVLGRRRPTSRGAWPLHARAGNAALGLMLYRRTGVRLHDLGPMRAARRAALLDLGVTDRRSGYPLETVVRAADAGWRIAELPVPYAPRTGKSKVTGTWRGTWQAVHDMSGVLRGDLRRDPRSAPDVLRTAPGGHGGTAGPEAVAGAGAGVRPEAGGGTGGTTAAGAGPGEGAGGGASAGAGVAAGPGAGSGAGARSRSGSGRPVSDGAGTRASGAGGTVRRSGGGVAAGGRGAEGGR